LKELHQVSVNEIPFQLQMSDTPQSWKEMYAQIQGKLYSFMRPDTRREVSEHFENFFVNIDQYEFLPRLRHGDFGTGNILFNPQSHSIAGIIDFGGVGLGDPASDFAGLYISFGEEFYRNCYSVYPEMEHAFKRVEFYIGTFALQEALFGYENDDQDAFNAGMEIFV
jgi:aminoglycoside 2''-phosphotransferase